MKLTDRVSVALDKVVPGRKPKHQDKDGSKKSWSASEFTEDDYVDDDYIKRNAKEVE